MRRSKASEVRRGNAKSLRLGVVPRRLSLPPSDTTERTPMADTNSGGTPPEAWTPPPVPPPPADGWRNNRVAVQARTLLFVSLAVLALSWLVLIVGRLIPDPTAQVSLILLAWVALLAVTVLAIISIVFASIGLYRASRLGGYRRGTALAGLLGAAAVLLLALPFTSGLSIALSEGIHT